LADQEYLRLSLRSVVREHNKSCLCKECRAECYFDLISENHELRKLVSQTLNGLSASIDTARSLGNDIPDAISKPVAKLQSKVSKLLYVDYPDFRVRGEIVDLLLQPSIIRSLVGDIPAEREEIVEPSGEGPYAISSRTVLPSQSVKFLGDGLEKLLGLPPMEDDVVYDVPKEAVEDLKDKL
jgi:hypothetical protein